MAGGAVRRRDREAVGAAAVEGIANLRRRRGGKRRVSAGVESLQFGQIDPLDIAADAAFGEGECHPRLEAGDRLRPHLGMGGEIVIEAIRPGIHQPLQPVGAGGVSRLEVCRIHVEAGAQVGPDRLLALGLGGAAERGQIVGLDPIEVVFGLGVDHAEHGIGIGPAADMRDAPVVARDRHPLRLPLPAGEVGVLCRDRGAGGGDEREDAKPPSRHPSESWDPS